MSVRPKMYSHYHLTGVTLQKNEEDYIRLELEGVLPANSAEDNAVAFHEGVCRAEVDTAA